MRYGRPEYQSASSRRVKIIVSPWGLTSGGRKRCEGLSPISCYAVGKQRDPVADAPPILWQRPFGQPIFDILDSWCWAESLMEQFEVLGSFTMFRYSIQHLQVINIRVPKTDGRSDFINQ